MKNLHKLNSFKTRSKKVFITSLMSLMLITVMGVQKSWATQHQGLSENACQVENSNSINQNSKNVSEGEQTYLESDLLLPKWAKWLLHLVREVIDAWDDAENGGTWPMALNTTGKNDSGEFQFDSESIAEMEKYGITVEGQNITFSSNTPLARLENGEVAYIAPGEYELSENGMFIANLIVE